MAPGTTALVAALLLAMVALAVHLLVRRREHRRERVAAIRLGDVAELGPVVPPTRHPVIDPNRCIGSGACVRACPEHALAVVGGHARLINPLGCVGHGVCADACAVGAIKLVVGTADVGVTVPRLGEGFETDRPGLYVVGELSGMGLIKNAVEHGRKAAAHIVASGRRGKGEVFDAVVVGAGPAGISATLGLMEAGLRVVTLDREELGGTIRHYPRAKVAMTGALVFPLYGTVRRRTMSKEELVALWAEIAGKTGLDVRSGELVESVSLDGDGSWTVRSTAGERRAANVVLALGRRGSPRKLHVPGEELPKVIYRVLEPGELSGARVLVVGGGNAAVETALALADAGGCRSVTLSYRRSKLARCRGDNRRRIEEAFEDGRVAARLPSEVIAIEPDAVLLSSGGETVRLANDVVVVQVGGTPPSELLERAGVVLVEKRGEA